jgi:hypothetical protein
MAQAALGATCDATAPTLTGVSISPATIETSTGAKTVTVRVSGTDAGSGIQYARVFWTAPGNTSQFSAYSTVPVTGTANNGSIDVVATFPANAAQGDWKLYVRLVDNLINSAHHTSSLRTSSTTPSTMKADNQAATCASRKAAQFSVPRSGALLGSWRQRICSRSSRYASGHVESPTQYVSASLALHSRR